MKSFFTSKFNLLTILLVAMCVYSVFLEDKVNYQKWKIKSLAHERDSLLHWDLQVDSLLKGNGIKLIKMSPH